MASLPTLYPTSDVSNNGWTDEAGGSTNLFNVVDEVGAAGTDYIRTDLDGCDIGFGVTDMPSDFLTMNSLQVEVRHSRGTVESGSAGSGNDTWELYAYIVTADGSTALAGGNSSPANGQLVNTSTQGYVPETDTVSFTYVNDTATKTDWDGARLFIEGVFTASGGTDSHRVWIDTVRLVSGDYDVATVGGPAQGGLIWLFVGSGAKLGEATGTITWAGTANGTTQRRGSGSGSITWAGVANGTTQRRGASTGSITWAGTSTGVRVPKGAPTGTITWAGSATGEAPLVVQDGSATGSISWAGTASGTTNRNGAATGAIAWIGAAVGATAHRGSGVGAVAWSGVAVGGNPKVGASTGTITWAGSAVGQHPNQIFYALAAASSVTATEATANGTMADLSGGARLVNVEGG